MNTVKVILATLVIFAAGVITGAFAVRITQPKAAAGPVEEARQPRESRIFFPNTPFNRPDFLERMQREVGLRAEQQGRVEQILRDSRQRTEPLVHEFNPKLRAEIQLVREQILQELDADQRASFEGLLRSRNPQQNRPGSRAGQGDGSTQTTNPPASRR